MGNISETKAEIKLSQPGSEQQNPQDQKQQRKRRGLNPLGHRESTVIDVKGELLILKRLLYLSELRVRRPQTDPAQTESFSLCGLVL